MSKYLMTEDLEYLMQRWSEDSGFNIPDHQFFVSLQQELTEYLSSIFTDLVFVSLDDLSGKLRKKIELARDTLLVSIDQIYNSTEYHLESNRIADQVTLEIIGEAQRPGYPSLAEQIILLPKDKSVVLVDDGCFSGDTLYRIVRLLRKSGITIQAIIVGVLINRQHNRLFQEYPDMCLEAVYEFNEVIDWICERDFYLGVPLSGRTAGFKEFGIIKPCQPEISIPYCLPFGDPVESASIPTEKAEEFSYFIIQQSVSLWEEVERKSNRSVLTRDIPRLPKGVKRGNQRFVDVLKQSANLI